jgi:hypothetical protein
MNSWTADPATVDELVAKSREVRPGRVLLTVLAAIGTAIGWAIGRFFLAVGWLAGRAWLIGAFFTEAVIYGFRGGAKIPQPAPAEDAGRTEVPGQ